LHWRMHNLSSDTASTELRDSNHSDTSSRGNVRPARRARRASTRFACRRDRALHFGSQRPSVRRVGFWLNPSQTQFDVANGRKSDRQGAGENRPDFKGCGIVHRTRGATGYKNAPEEASGPPSLRKTSRLAGPSAPSRASATMSPGTIAKGRKTRNFCLPHVSLSLPDQGEQP
jgi:hypothetical protein